MSSAAVIIFGKNPVPGRVKTRLAAEVGLEAAADLYRAFLIDTLELVRGLALPLRLYLEPEDAPLDPALAQYDSLHLRQEGDDLGERMHNAIAETFASGFEPVAIIGSDHPTLPRDSIGEALDAVSDRDTIAIGPSSDGGYYLLAMARPQPSLFTEMSYSHDGVFSDTVDRARKAGLRIVTLDRWYDIDTVDDLRRLSEDVNADLDSCPHTRASLMRGGLIENTR